MYGVQHYTDGNEDKRHTEASLANVVLQRTEEGKLGGQIMFRKREHIEHLKKKEGTEDTVALHSRLLKEKELRYRCG